jgi:RND family efflux transporter MFP subunit
MEVETAVVLEETGGTAASARTAGVVLNASGYVTARRKATVSAKVTGKIEEVRVEEGMVVEEGQILARLDDVNVRRFLELNEARLVSAQSALDETRARRVEAEREFERVQQLTTGRVASDSDFDRAEASLKSLQARLIQQEAEILVAQRQVNVQEQDLDDLTIRAPFRGVVVSKDAQPGEMISPVSAGGAFTRTGICTLVDMESLEIEVDVNEAYIQRVSSGQLVTATLDAYPNWKIPCHVIAIIPTADRQKATVRVRIGFEKLDPRIYPEMGVKVAFQEAPVDAAAESGQSGDAAGVGKLDRRLTVPRSAIQREGGKAFVWVLDKGRVNQRQVVSEDTQNERVRVNSGLFAGERVVVSDVKQLKDGQRVREAKL